MKVLCIVCVGEDWIFALAVTKYYKLDNSFKR